MMADYAAKILERSDVANGRAVRVCAVSDSHGTHYRNNSKAEGSVVAGFELVQDESHAVQQVLPRRPSLSDIQQEYIHDSISSRVTLPGVGPVCSECLSRGHLPGLRLLPREVYSFGMTEPYRQLDWNVDAARALVVARPRTALRLDSSWLRSWLAERTTVTAEHLAHIPVAKLDEPAIIVEIIACPPGGRPQPFRILIDGTYRAALKLRQRQDCWAYLLTEQEQRSICMYRVEHEVVDVPTFPGRGISDEEAGIFPQFSSRE